MNPRNTLIALGWAALIVAGTLPALAGEGHDHGGAAVVAGPALPSVTAVSETFELVGRLYPDEMSILIDRAASNEPVLDSKLTVDLDGRSVLAPFHSDHGDYSLTDAEILKKLREPGVKTMTFTLVAGAENDLLAGELEVHEEAHTGNASQPRDWKKYALWAGPAGVILILLVMLVRRRASRNPRLGGVA